MSALLDSCLKPQLASLDMTRSRENLLFEKVGFFCGVEDFLFTIARNEGFRMLVEGGGRARLPVDAARAGIVYELK